MFYVDNWVKLNEEETHILVTSKIVIIRTIIITQRNQKNMKIDHFWIQKSWGPTKETDVKKME